MNCGAISEEEATETGLTIDEIRSRSFIKYYKAETEVKIFARLCCYYHRLLRRSLYVQ